MDNITKIDDNTIGVTTVSSIAISDLLSARGRLVSIINRNNTENKNIQSQIDAIDVQLQQAQTLKVTSIETVDLTALPLSTVSVQPTPVDALPVNTAAITP